MCKIKKNNDKLMKLKVNEFDVDDIRQSARDIMFIDQPS